MAACKAVGLLLPGAYLLACQPDAAKSEKRKKVNCISFFGSCILKHDGTPCRSLQSAVSGLWFDWLLVEVWNPESCGDADLEARNSARCHAGN